MFEQMKDKVALVTGAASGIGRASALAFAKVGSRVIVADRDRQGGLETVNLIEKTGAEAVFEQVNISSIDQVEALIASIVARFGRLDYAHNNAGAEAPPSRKVASS
jgi:NAD(P)-dependent dehydrogenase (short-subunit alcohol dehydrogenase family)